jgi:diguanylate cyclase (GGDEF)-like protein/putative nucleotidyltransferase with HDIG domain
VSHLTDIQYALVPLVGRLLLVVFFLYIYRKKREQFLLYWGLAWTLLAFSYLGEIHPSLLGRTEPAVGLVGGFCIGAAAVLLYDSGRALAGSSVMRLTPLLAPAFLFWLLLQLGLGGFFTRVPLSVAAGVVALLTAYYCWRESQRHAVIGGPVLALGFLLWGLVLVEPVFYGVFPALTALDRVWLENLPLQLMGLSMLVVLYEAERHDMEHHMLGLAGLNLIASTAQQSATVQEMVGLTLDRLLTAQRVPAGTIALKLEEQETLSCIHRGQGTAFLKELEQVGLLPFLQRTVGRLGGLMVFPDLRQAEAPAAFSHEPDYRRLASLARAEGIRLLIGVSLRAKTGDQGVLLLASPEARRFQPAELRLLLGLGGQIGLAVENYHLLQQSARRADELRVLNEIGRALSSALTVDELLERMHAEIQKVIDARNFYIALYDLTRGDVAFELEVMNGQFLPKRRRRARNGLTEYILRTRKPLLIREKFDQVMQELGVEPGRTARSYCAVPILLHGEGVGVMGIVNYEETAAFDQEHVEVMTILAAQAAVAIENARLFGQEQRRAQQLSLLNNVSRKAIATLNPEEMLTTIAEEMRANLPYEHIGMGVLDYTTREVVVQAETSHGMSGLHWRFKLGEGLVGEAAATGTMVRMDALAPAESPRRKPVLPDAQSAVALPIIYAEQVLGVLNVESRRPNIFREEDILLLRTLADVIASALHNAFVFQKAQEQAITDGLTGVKTHRFFMEALAAEWRRATRANRQFSLVLLDLDKFKPINDYFGHLEGDLVLQRVGNILEQNVRRSDVVARYGGDEFVVLMPETSADQAYQLGDKLRQWLATDPLLKEKKISASVGIATFPHHGATPQELIQIADASMYLAKHQGGNLVVSADHYKVTEQKQWQRNVLEAYLGVTIKRLFSTGPEAFDEVYHRLEEVTKSLGAPGQDWREVPVPVLETVTSLAVAIDAKDHYTQGHSQNVARYCVQMARAKNLPDIEVEEIRQAALLHDVGKIGIPERILNKPGGLDEDEFEVMKEHSVLGAKILEPLRSLKNIQKIVRHHHEQWDGSGYPDGLAGEAIPFVSRMIAIADAYDTMISERTYKQSRTRMQAVEELRRCAGSQFDPELVEVFAEVVKSSAEAHAEVPRAPGD